MRRYGSCLSDSDSCSCIGAVKMAFASSEQLPLTNTTISLYGVLNSTLCMQLYHLCAHASARPHKLSCGAIEAASVHTLAVLLPCKMVSKAQSASQVHLTILHELPLLMSRYRKQSSQVSCGFAVQLNAAQSEKGCGLLPVMSEVRIASQNRCLDSHGWRDYQQQEQQLGQETLQNIFRALCAQVAQCRNPRDSLPSSPLCKCPHLGCGDTEGILCTQRPWKAAYAPGST